MDGTTIIGIAAGTCTGISLLPQLIKIIREKKAQDISLFYLFILLAGLALWIWYGIRQEDMPIIITNAVSLVLNGSIIFLGIKYKGHSQGRH
jgi:MtN3 and saliva related transmembrane protein